MANDELEYTGSLFEDVEFFFILIAVFGVMTGVGVLWEYFWYKPKMLKAVKNNTEDIPKYILTDEEVQNLCENCCCRVEAIYQKDGQERKERLEADQSDSSISKLDNLIPLRRAKNLPKKDHV